MTGHSLYTIIPYKGRLLKFTEAVSARLYYKDHYIDLLTQKKHSYDVSEWLKTLEFTIHDHSFDKRVIHLFYELGYLFEGLTEFLNPSDILAIDIQFTKSSYAKSPGDLGVIHLEKVLGPNFENYKNKFMLGYDELLRGNCYQFNLTEEFLYKFDYVDVETFVAKLWSNHLKRGAYGSATYIESLGKLFLSNSPECLFRYKKQRLTSMPIKGTVKYSGDKSEFNSLWEALVKDEKNQAELYMITDLIRNDLSRIDVPVSKVVKKKAPLVVPGILHQYSEVQVHLRSHITLKNVLEKIFPGGSITGAPKKRTMKILKKLEERSRGFYCGSTLVFFPDSIEASINIRASVVDFTRGELSYQAGGGLTLLSDPQEEFDEITYKHDSYMSLLTL